MSLLVALAALCWWTARLPVIGTRTSHERHLPVLAHANIAALPGGLRLPSAERTEQFVSLVAADIDADGDVDVIAANNSLELFVWTNDGSGRLERKEPRRSHGWQAEPASSSVGGNRTVVLVWVQNTLPSVHDHLRAHAAVLATRAMAVPAADDSAATSSLGPQAPRAPPVPVSLA